MYGKVAAEESLLVIQKLGVEIERLYFSGKRTFEFVDIDTIEDWQQAEYLWKVIKSK